jgi:hypothetical protein
MFGLLLEMKIEPDIRRNILLAISGLVVANVRNVIQYGEFAIGSVWYFLGTWLIHYLAIGVIGAVALAIYSSGRSKYVYGGDGKEAVSAGEFLYIV